MSTADTLERSSNPLVGVQPALDLAAADLHLSESPVVREVCLVRQHSGWTCVVVPEEAELTARRVPLVLMRSREATGIAAAHLPHPIELAEHILRFEPLPRDADGRVDREAVERWLHTRRARHEATAPPPEGAAGRFVARLQETTNMRGPFEPWCELEHDLGMDSMNQVQMRVLLREEFGVEIGHEALWRWQTLGDVLDAVRAADAPEPKTGRRYDWSTLVAEPDARPLARRYNLRRSWWRNAVARSLVEVSSAIAQVLWRPEVVGLENLPGDGVYLIAPTHQSFLDAPLIYTQFPRSVVRQSFFIGFGEVLQGSAVSWVVSPFRAILTGDAETNPQCLQVAYEALSSGHSIVIFPEAGRSYMEDVMPPKVGAAVLSLEAQVPIVPVVFQGTARTLSPSVPGVRPCRSRMIIGEPITPPARRPFGPADYRAQIDCWLEAVTSLQREHGGRDYRP